MNTITITTPMVVADSLNPSQKFRRFNPLSRVLGRKLSIVEEAGIADDFRDVGISEEEMRADRGDAASQFLAQGVLHDHV
ncbi:MAG: hypothetical protein OEU36_21370 [Gammaproteobacteria bacterium]|nr:hypothetical protein [Gammaproteobacteria bacterium]